MKSARYINLTDMTPIALWRTCVAHSIVNSKQIVNEALTILLSRKEISNSEGMNAFLQYQKDKPKTIQENTKRKIYMEQGTIRSSGTKGSYLYFRMQDAYNWFLHPKYTMTNISRYHLG